MVPLNSKVFWYVKRYLLSESSRLRKGGKELVVTSGVYLIAFVFMIISGIYFIVIARFWPGDGSITLWHNIATIISWLVLLVALFGYSRKTVFNRADDSFSSVTRFFFIPVKRVSGLLDDVEAIKVDVWSRSRYFFRNKEYLLPWFRPTYLVSNEKVYAVAYLLYRGSEVRLLNGANFFGSPVDFKRLMGFLETRIVFKGDTPVIDMFIQRVEEPYRWWERKE